ncbi:cytochrome P450 [Streptomyces iconiensis]|uniref:Cytochrome P450 n=1 Tax=Streptomyces iconiensis TaxID=1384038 RepID=A0ABT6ZT01_9ACTN|nr:cytochrome P450 [Streptomyces iconiensis]MDJ1131919.1 cytochrome P450 [Streptomyces iconiensis]
MTTPPYEHPHFASKSGPPPGCPAHARGIESARLYGPEVEADYTAAEEALRKRFGPVAPVTLQGDVPAWLILGYRENLEVMRNPSLFTRDSRHWNIQLDEGSPLAPLTAWQPLTNLTDGEEHTRLRAAVTQSLANFSSRQESESGGHGVHRYVVWRSHQLIDQFAARGSADLISEFADLLPLRVISRLLGLSEAHVPALVDSVRDTISGSATAVTSSEQITRLLYDLVALKREVPGHDITSRLITHKLGERLGEEHLRQEVAEHLRMLLTATHSTTAPLLGSTLRMSLSDRRFRGHLAGGQMTLPTAVEQVLWDSPPFPRLVGRWATADTDLAEQRIRKGDLLVHGLAAANRDPKIRPDLDEPMHGNNAHLSFSAGPHECPGKNLARGIVSAGIDVLQERLEGLRLAVPTSEVHESQALMSRHLDRLPVTFTPRPHRAGVGGPPGAQPQHAPIPQSGTATPHALSHG